MSVKAITQTLKNLKIPNASVSNVFGKMSKAQLGVMHAIATGEAAAGTPAPGKAQMIEALAQEMEITGLARLLHVMKLATLKLIAEAFGDGIRFKDTDCWTKNVLKKRIAESVIGKGGLSSFLQTFKVEESVLEIFLIIALEVATLAYISPLMAYSSLEKGSKARYAALVEEVTRQVQRMGMEIFFSRLDYRFLVEVCAVLGLSKIAVKETNVDQLVKAITTLSDAGLKSSKKSSGKIKRPKRIERGVSFEELFLLPREELDDWCRQEGVIISNKNKAVQIELILAYLEGDKENTAAPVNTSEGQEEKPLKKRRGKKPKALKRKKPASTKEEKPKAEEKQEEKEERENVEEEEEEVEIIEDQSEEEKEEATTEEKKEEVEEEKEEVVEEVVEEKPKPAKKSLKRRRASKKH